MHPCEKINYILLNCRDYWNTLDYRNGSLLNISNLQVSGHGFITKSMIKLLIFTEVKDKVGNVGFSDNYIPTAFAGTTFLSSFAKIKIKNNNNNKKRTELMLQHQPL